MIRQHFVSQIYGYSLKIWLSSNIYAFFKSEANFYFLDKSALGKQILLLDDDYMDMHFLTFYFIVEYS